MAYDIKLADRIREYLNAIPNIKIEERKMFGGLAFMINDKMYVCVSGENLMCRFDPTCRSSRKKRFSNNDNERQGIQRILLHQP